MQLVYLGCKVVLKDNRTDKVLCETQVVEHDRSQNQIFLFGIERERLPKIVLVILYHPNGIFEFQGNVRKVDSSGLLEISLFQKKVPKKRKNERYDLKMKVSVAHVPSRSPAEELTASVQNISVSGILVNTDEDILAIGDTFCIKLPINGVQVPVKTQVVRLHGKTENGYEYGCEFESILPSPK